MADALSSTLPNFGVVTSTSGFRGEHLAGQQCDLRRNIVVRRNV